METYLGDGVFAKIDRGMIELKTDREDGIHIIYLETEVLAALIRFARTNMRKEIWEQMIAA